MSRKYIINLGRELGSGGREIGEIIAKKLSIDFYDKRLIRIAAEQSGLSSELFERVDESSDKGGIATLVSYLRSPFAGADAANNSILSGDSLFQIQSDVMRDVASRGSALFVGRCADYILRDEPCCVNIFISVDFSHRVERVVKCYALSEPDAIEKIRSCDESRAEYYNYYTLGEWGRASTYHLCVNSSVLGVEATADYIIDFVNKAEIK